MYKYFAFMILAGVFFRQTVAQTHLSVNQSVTCDVYAEKTSTSSGVFLEAGKTYKITASASDKWTDDYIETNADGFTSSSGKDDVARAALKLSEGLRRVADANWFCLIGYTLYSIPLIGKYTFKAGSSKTITIPANKGGVLFLYANDVSTMYWNNHGKISVTVKRIQ